MLNQSDDRLPLEVYATRNPDDHIRRESSSGGIFTLLAEQTIDAGGVVFGVCWDDHFEAMHAYTETKEGLSSFRGSKYVQSRVGYTFKQAELFLQQGRQVLYSGTPCQIAGLKRYLMRPYDNLLTVDIVCYGIPSPGVWRRYLHDFRSSIIAGQSPVLTGVNFRDKRHGWKSYSFCLRYLPVDGEEKEYLQPFTATPYMQGFIEGLYLRPSCFRCPSKSGKSNSDITIADAWGIDQFAPEYDDDKGTCCVFGHTPAGLHRLQRLQLPHYPVSVEQVRRYNSSFFTSAHPHPKRHTFFTLYSASTTTVEQLIHKILAPTLFEQLYRRVRHLFSPLKKLLRK